VVAPLGLTVPLTVAVVAVMEVALLVVAVGTEKGVTPLEGLEAGPVPIALVAFTVKVYAVPLVSPVTVMGLDAPVAVMLPGLEVTV